MKKKLYYINMEEFDWDRAGYVIEDYLLQQEFYIISEGVVGSKFKFSFGRIERVIENLEMFECRIYYDCPFLFPLKEGYTENFYFENREVAFVHSVKNRGKQEFSTLDIIRLRQFSHIQIVIQFFKEDFVEKANGLKEDNMDDLSWRVINHLNSKINDVISKATLKIDLASKNILSYRYIFHDKSDYHKDPIIVVFPYTSETYTEVSDDNYSIDEEILKLYLANKIQLKQFFEEYIPKVQDYKDFESLVFRIVHDFAYYASERPESLFNLGEELIRDLMLVAMKIVLPNSDAEVFQYDGRLDFKVTNPLNKYDVISGEIKIWDGRNSFDKIMHQITQKHSTGAESEIYLLFINKNKNCEQTYLKSLELLKSSPHYISEVNSNISLSRKQYFSKHLINIKGTNVPLIFGILNVFHERV